LQRVLEAPKGWTADNAGLALDHDGRQIAFASGTQARLWQVPSGQLLGSWTLPMGMNDALAFRPDNKLLLCRLEAKGAAPGVYDEQLFRKPSFVLPLRELNKAHRFGKLIKEIPTTPHGLIIQAVPDGSSFVIRSSPEKLDYIKGPVKPGLSNQQPRPWTVTVLNGADGNVVGSQSFDPVADEIIVAVDPTGKVASVSWGDPQRQPELFELPALKPLGTFPFDAANIWRLSPDARLSVGGGPVPNAPQNWLGRRGDARHFLALRFDPEWGGNEAQFNVAGTHLAITYADGSVLVCDLPEMQRQLAPFGLGW
jgi:hypothetical protein